MHMSTKHGSLNSVIKLFMIVLLIDKGVSKTLYVNLLHRDYVINSYCEIAVINRVIECS